MPRTRGEIVMRRAMRPIAMLLFAIALAGCQGTAGPSWLHPGDADTQQKRALRYDPYPEPDTGRARRSAPGRATTKHRWPIRPAPAGSAATTTPIGGGSHSRPRRPSRHRRPSGRRQPPPAPTVARRQRRPRRQPRRLRRSKAVKCRLNCSTPRDLGTSWPGERRCLRGLFSLRRLL